MYNDSDSDYYYYCYCLHNECIFKKNFLKNFQFIGPLNTLIQVLLTTIFDLEEDEEADMKDSHISGLDFY